MTDRQESFAVGDRPRVRIRLASGDVRVLPGDAGHIEVTASSGDGLVFEQAGDTVTIREERGRGIFRRAHDVRVRVPAEVDIEAELAAADLGAEAPIRTLEATTASGDVRATEVTGDAEIRTASGDVALGRVGGSCSVATASGDIRVGEVGGETSCTSASGDVRVETCAGPVTARTASGTIGLGCCSGDTVDVRSLSGDAAVGVPRGVRLTYELSTLSGDVRAPESTPTDAGTPAPTAEPRPAVRVRGRSVSGDLGVRVV